MKSIAIAFAAALLCCCTSGVSELNYRRLNAEAEKEYQTPLRPYKEGVSPCWNPYAKDFKFAPVFDFKKMEGAAKYRYTVWQDSDNSYFWTTPMQQRPDNMFPKHQPTDTTAGLTSLRPQPSAGVSSRKVPTSRSLRSGGRFRSATAAL